MEFDVAVFKGTDLYKNLTQSQKEYTIKVLEDGILAYDRNGNGKIDDGGELFGNFTQIKDKDGNQRLAKHGYEALANLDSNKDGIIDINDKDFNKLRIWQDINKDGVSQINELRTLDELNIKSLNLNYNEVNQDYGKQINF